MSKSAQLRMRDIRQAYRLIGDCRDLGADPVLWQSHMLEGLSHLVAPQLPPEARADGAVRPNRPFRCRASA